MKSFAALFFSGLVSSVAAHGFVSEMIIGGKTYKGPNPYNPQKLDSPIRKITTINPITSATSPDLTCGIGSKFASMVAPATAGSQVTFTWKAGSGNWGHTLGPIETYLAPCDGDCTKFDAKNAKFFKVAETGRKPGSMAWYQADIKAGKSYTMTIPKDVPSGDYIMRHELIALHFAEKINGAQYYPSCSQIRITGSSSKVLPSDTTTFPGGYHANDKGLFVPNLFVTKDYIFPGPKMAKFGVTNNVAIGLNSTMIADATSTTSTVVATSTGKTTCTHKARRSRIMAHHAS